ncbi:hypothetical protein THASP1DRAFT_24860 [Thamnocephalis sphaerospora]|uniref:Protein kinase domain-containing protein n=1 Tax=Thamnocephalis sphaerospora TaxID=78915 RepID=A0A4P9XM40_9FUNG|nr:hypothetical protein THASP1DRAFT_24860 [Thamnocephalis sphaerospora]|eukprot:RKP06902.1 hypothetical protein THASP1DRAFT_24860 [Thamnocephalis sphaerospora]
MAAAFLVLWSNDALAATLPDSTVTATTTAADPTALSQQPTPTRPSAFSQPARLLGAPHTVLLQQLVEDTGSAVPLLRPVPTHPPNFGRPAQFPVMTLAPSRPVYTTFATYKGQRCLLKCMKDGERSKAEKDALDAIHANSPEKYGFHASVKSAFVRILSKERAANGMHCVILERLNGISLRQFAGMLTFTQRDKILPGIFAQFIKVYAPPWLGARQYRTSDDTFRAADIIIARTVNNTPRVIITNFDSAQMAETAMRYSVGGTHGYRPPEDYSSKLVNQYARDSWMTGATIYASFAGAPPYGLGYDPSTKKAVVWTDDQMKGEMLKIRDTGVNSCKDIVFPNSARLLALMKMLMVPKFEMRSSITQISSDVLGSIAQSATVPSSMQGVWAKMKPHMNALSS